MKWLNYEDLATFLAILAMFSLRLRRNIDLGAYGKNLDTDIRFLDPHFHTSSEILAISGRFPLIFH